ncbi:hypothetical protein [Arthrobacter sp. TB 26]|uniref:hypothetical protein n=1 Tax=Arthrobacter sp. TB 26 TaxID=494420 RepID=UPI000409EF1D
MMPNVVVPAGILLPESFLHSQWFAIMATFVAINTVMYAALAVSKILPKLHRPNWLRRRHERSETRSIYPEAPK